MSFLSICCKENYLQFSANFPLIFNSFSPAKYTSRPIQLPYQLEYNSHITFGLEMPDCEQRRVQIPINDDRASSSFDLLNRLEHIVEGFVNESCQERTDSER
uniref:Uncharacterized protein n=1 Tax=Glossina austeni TaxID=7395 RepID=A0A1A9V2X6_GLOAU